jgi:hypothetical protein
MSKLQVKCCYNSSTYPDFYYDAHSDKFFINLLNIFYGSAVEVFYCPWCGCYLDGSYQ